MHRLRFEKTGNAVWISHLDLMRLFQRAFKRAGLPLTHTQGYNPRPSVSIALPLSVGTESLCELLDYELDHFDVPLEEIPLRLNTCLVPGIRVVEAYVNGRKLRDLSLMRAQVTLIYDKDCGDAAQKIRELFARPCLTAPKKTKNGLQEQDIIPLLRSIEVSKQDERHILLDAVFCCQNPTLNPMQLAQAVKLHLPDCAFDFSTCRRLEVYDDKNTIFR